MRQLRVYVWDELNSYYCNNGTLTWVNLATLRSSHTSLHNVNSNAMPPDSVFSCPNDSDTRNERWERCNLTTQVRTLTVRLVFPIERHLPQAMN